MFQRLLRRIRAIIDQLWLEHNLFGRPATIAVLVLSAIQGLFWLNWYRIYGSVPNTTELNLLLAQIQLPIALSRGYDVLLGPLVLLINAVILTSSLFETFDEDDPDDWRDIVLAVFLAFALGFGIIFGMVYFVLILTITVIAICVCGWIAAVSATKNSSSTSI